jgi:hypothetical protein
MQSLHTKLNLYNRYKKHITIKWVLNNWSLDSGLDSSRLIWGTLARSFERKKKTYTGFKKHAPNSSPIVRLGTAPL